MGNRRRVLADRIAGRFMLLLSVSSGLLICVMAWALLRRSLPILAVKPLSAVLLSDDWMPMRGAFGLFPFIMGTIWVTAAAVLIAVPLSLLAAVYLSEYAPAAVRSAAAPLVDLLAGIPSVIYGIWGILAIVPLIKNRVGPLFGVHATGYSVLAGGVVLAVMIAPVIIHVAAEVFAAVPREMREASLALGATRWQTVRHVVLRRARAGLFAAVGLGFSRAFGETMAVLMVAGNVARVPSSVFDPAYPLPALIANNYGEMLSIPLYDAALMLAALVLLLVVLVFNVVSRIVLIRIEGGLR
ncbi:MAG: phosphate ABC transporter permease subunit PstC [bacterium]|nr:phosphate ABC transporter permease subunit PstC [bacterium]